MINESLPVISVLFMTAIILLNQNGGVSLGLLLPLTTLVVPVRLLDHPGGVVEFPLLAIGQRQSAQIRLAAAVARSCQSSGTDHAVQSALATRIVRVTVIVCVAIAVEMKLQLQKLAEVGRGGRRGRRVRCQAAAGGTRRTRVSIGVRDRRGAAVAVAIRVEQFSGVEGL